MNKINKNINRVVAHRQTGSNRYRRLWAKICTYVCVCVFQNIFSVAFRDN